jgi:predicted acylesterase/phospholipase RssA
MNFQLRPHLTKAEQRLPFECVALLLQGGGALGAYQGGVYEALAEANIHPDWIAGISIGAINGAIIAGNPPHSRVDRLREFWTQVTTRFGTATGHRAIDHIKTEAALAAPASGRMPGRCPAVGGSLWIWRVAVHTPGH